MAVSGPRIGFAGTRLIDEPVYLSLLGSQRGFLRHRRELPAGSVDLLATRIAYGDRHAVRLQMPDELGLDGGP